MVALAWIRACLLLLLGLATHYRSSWSTRAYVEAEGGGWWEATERQAKALSKLKKAKINDTPIGAVFTSTYHTNQLNQWTTSSASRMVIYSFLSTSPGYRNHLKTIHALVNIWQASETSQSKSSLDNSWYKCLPEQLLYLYSYHMIVKMCFALLYICMETSLFSNVHLMVIPRLEKLYSWNKLTF